jgi:hypothetical protein
LTELRQYGAVWHMADMPKLGIGAAAH